MRMTRRQVFSFGGAVALASLSSARSPAEAPAPALAPMTGGVRPIPRTEYLARLDKARALMGRHGIGALLIEPGASLVYFTGVQWWRSERLTVAILPRDGELAIVTPHFEEPSVRESLRVPADVRVWNEHDDPLATVARSAARSASRKPCVSSPWTGCARSCRVSRSRPAPPWCGAAAW